MLISEIEEGGVRDAWCLGQDGVKSKDTAPAHSSPRPANLSLTPRVLI